MWKMAVKMEGGGVLNDVAVVVIGIDGKADEEPLQLHVHSLSNDA